MARQVQIQVRPQRRREQPQRQVYYDPVLRRARLARDRAARQASRRRGE